MAQKRKRDNRAIQNQIAAERAEAAYENWLAKNNFNCASQLPQECEKRRQSIESPYLKSLVCNTCSNSWKKHVKSGKTREERICRPIKVSPHQEEKNIEPIGKPEKLLPYTNYSIGSSQKHKDEGSNVASASSSKRGTPYGSGRTSRSVSLPSSARLKANRSKKPGHGKKLPDNAKTPPYSVPTISTMMMDCGEDSEEEPGDNEIDELDFSHLEGNDLAYPQYDFDDIGNDDDGGLFHDVGDFNNLESLSLPSAMTKDKTPAEILQLLRNNPDTNRKRFRRSNSYSHMSKPSSMYSRRLSLNSIPEDKVVTDYSEQEDEDNNIDSQLLRHLERVFKGYSNEEEEEEEEEEETAEERREGEVLGVADDDDDDDGGDTAAAAAESKEGVMRRFDDGGGDDEEEKSASDPVELESTCPEAAPLPLPTKTLKIVNFSWDSSSNSVQVHVSPSPISSSKKKQKSSHKARLSLCTERRRKDSPSHKSHSLPHTTAPFLKTTPILLKVAPPTHKTNPIVPPARKKLPPPDDTHPDVVATSSHDAQWKTARKHTPPSQEATLPPRKATPPSRKTTPPPRKATPSRKDTPPSQKTMPPSRKDTPPSQNISRKTTPSPRKATPPSQKDTPPSQKTTPPSQKTTPPSRKITPPSRPPLSPLPFLAEEMDRSPTPPQSSPIHISLSDPGMAPKSSFQTEDTPPGHATPVFHIGEPPQEAKSQVRLKSSTGWINSLFSP